MSFLPIFGPYLLAFLGVSLLLWSIYLYKKGYDQGKRKADKYWMEIFKTKVDEDLESEAEWEEDIS